MPTEGTQSLGGGVSDRGLKELERTRLEPEGHRQTCQKGCPPSHLRTSIGAGASGNNMPYDSDGKSRDREFVRRMHPIDEVRWGGAGEQHDGAASIRPEHACCHAGFARCDVDVWSQPTGCR